MITDHVWRPPVLTAAKRAARTPGLPCAYLSCRQARDAHAPRPDRNTPPTPGPGRLVDDHVWRDFYGQTPRGVRAWACAYMNCRRSRAEHARAADRQTAGGPA